MSSVPVVFAAGVAGWAYISGTTRIPARSGKASAHRAQSVAFGLGLFAVMLATAAPFHHLAEERLWAHMTQHVVLVAVASPLLVLANPLPAFLWALPTGLRERVQPAWRRLSRSHAQPRGWVTWAAVALAVQTVTIWLWHAPGPYQAALRSEWLHGLQHASFLGTALFFWWAVLGARRRSLYGPAVLATFFAAVQGTALGAFMTLAGAPWYDAYTGTSTLSALEDQQVAGVIMWGPGGMVYAVAAAAMFAAWIGRPERSRPVPA